MRSVLAGKSDLNLMTAFELMSRPRKLFHEYVVAPTYSTITLVN